VPPDVASSPAPDTGTGGAGAWSGAGAHDEDAVARVRWGRLLLRVLVAVVVLGVVYVGVTYVQVWRASREDGARAADVIVVMGAAQYDGRPSPALAGRLDHALELWREGIAPLIVVTGGKQPGDRFTEASASANYLLARGVPDAAILREVDGGSSWESLAATARILRNRDLSSAVLVSDPYHALRLRGIADEVGLDAVVSPTDGSSPASKLARETAAVALGRIVGYHRLGRLVSS